MGSSLSGEKRVWTKGCIYTGSKGFSMARSLVEAAKEGRRELLLAARDRLAEEIDKGVPAHALRNLVAELTRIDMELRGEPGEDNGVVIPEDAPFDPGSI